MFSPPRLFKGPLLANKESLKTFVDGSTERNRNIPSPHNPANKENIENYSEEYEVPFGRGLNMFRKVKNKFYYYFFYKAGTSPEDVKKMQDAVKNMKVKNETLSRGYLPSNHLVTKNTSPIIIKVSKGQPFSKHKRVHTHAHIQEAASCSSPSEGLLGLQVTAKLSLASLVEKHEASH